MPGKAKGAPVRKTTAAPAPPRIPAAAAPAEERGGQADYRELLENYDRLRDESERRTVALASAAHELKTPLAIMSGYVDLLLAGKLGPLTDRQREVLADMRSSGSRLQHFIGDFLTYSAVETGSLNFRMEVADLNSCIEEICLFWMPRFRDKGVALYTTNDPPVQPFAFDYHKVQQVISNLLDNALKYTARGGSVWVAAENYVWERRSGGAAGSNVRLERRRGRSTPPNAARVTVGDTGTGIAAEYHQEIFQDFFRLPQSMNGSASGIGLGLGISRRLIGAHGGKIWVESTPGVGSKFSFLLPAPHQPAARAGG
jgi:signal transduction histidine kinase